MTTTLAPAQQAVLDALTPEWARIEEVRAHVAGDAVPGNRVFAQLYSLRAQGLADYREHEGRGQWRRSHA